MSSRITALANLIRSRQEQDERKFVVMLGAGASLASGMPVTDNLKTFLLDQQGPDIRGANPAERFDRLWTDTTPRNREVMLQTYFRQLRPSEGYRHLCGLIKDGYFDVVLTLNFDNMLEDTLEEMGVTDRTVLVRNDNDDEAVCTMMDNPHPRVKVLKLHGSARGAATLLFSQVEMADYPDPIRRLVESLTGRDLIVCGYGFDDMCMMRAFSRNGESIFCVNPAGANPKLKAMMSQRHSAENVIDSVEGRFDEFFKALAEGVRRTSPTAPQPPRVNPFKFLENYQTADREWFALRRRLTRTLKARLISNDPPRTIHLLGDHRVGKTSFVRAGLIASLQAANPPVPAIYLRCWPNLETWLPRELAPHVKRDVAAVSDEMPLPDLLEAVARSYGRVVLVLDQFERVVARFQDKSSDRNQLKQLLQKLHGATPDGMTIVYVGLKTDHNYIILLSQLGIPPETIEALEPRQVRKMIGVLSRKAGITFDQDAVDRVIKKYEEGRGTRQPFTLAHVQALCHLACTSSRVDAKAVERVENADLASLEMILNDKYDLFGLMEDVPVESQQAVLRQVTKFIADPGRLKLADCLNDRFTDIFNGAVRTRVSLNGH